ncbi:hypothetical protein HZC34_03905 [Candidatus Saganbacteria bacterium]|nr:hypothetical protein [Candidatus Saganbacteria bacterium]
MAELVQPIIINATKQAIAGSGGAILSAADRDVIKKRTGEIDTSKNFAEHVKKLFSQTKIIDEVQTGEKEKVEQDDFDTRIKLQRSLIKHAPKLNLPEERVEISVEAAVDDHIDRLEHALNTGIVDELKNGASPELIEWLNRVIELKQLHLKRVLCGTKNEFEELSIKIAKATKDARGLGLKISRKGVRFVEAKLETLAYETASYKLELLRSMQKISFDKEREKDICWLKAVISRLKRA